VDSEYRITLCGAETGWTIQLCDSGFVGVNEHGVDPNDGEFYFVAHGLFRTREAAVERLCRLLADRESAA
jgi:hypothetical protein